MPTSQDIPEINDYPNSGGYISPPGVSVVTNMQSAQLFADGHDVLKQYLWFYNQVKNNSPANNPNGTNPNSWDYKQGGAQYEGFGNFNYGATGTAMGIPEEVLLRMAGAAQGGAKTSLKNFGTPFGGPPYGDDPVDQAAIRDGIDFARRKGFDRPNNLWRKWINDLFGSPISPDIGTQTQSGITWTQPRDPLILDLDGDGTELTASNSAVLFDHNADGIKTGSQWARPDDCILVRDLNGNGLIDSGRELFGDQTVYTSGPLFGQTAANGFAALKALDKDAAGLSDGIFNASDVAYADLKVWRDLNQDGISQSNELLGLAESGVSAINLTQTATQVTQGKSTFTKTVSGIDANGNPVTTSTEQTVQNVNFTTNNFYRAFSDNPVVTAAAALLPQTQGAGMVRDLREAMSLGIGKPCRKLASCQRRQPKVRIKNRSRLSAGVSTIVPKLGFVGFKSRNIENSRAFWLLRSRIC